MKNTYTEFGYKAHISKNVFEMQVFKKEHSSIHTLCLKNAQVGEN